MRGKVLQNTIIHTEKISWNQFFSDFFCKNVDLTEKTLMYHPFVTQINAKNVL